jgi:glycosyltransferase involved in cell wall biosynthesis
MRVSVVVPARECAALLAACLDRITRQSIEPHEVIIAVGPSADGTWSVAQEIAAHSDRLSVIDNPRGDRASALNAALSRTTGDVIAFVDAQSLLALDYLEQALRVMEESGAPIVGGAMRPKSRTLVGRAVARALISPFGVGNSAFHFMDRADDVDSVYLGVYQRAVFDRVGPYDKTLLRTEDDDFNQRAREAGFRIRLDPRIRSAYLCRESLAALWRQYYGYGYWKMPLFARRPSSFRLRHLVPAAAVIGSGIVAILSVRDRRPYVLVAATGYCAVAAAFEARLGGRPSFGVRALFPVVTATMHLAYGVGSIQGAFRFRGALARVLGATSG